MGLPVVNWFDLEWEDWAEGVRFAARTAQLAKPLGARKLGYHAEILPPGKVSVPYHAHLVNEEMFLVLGGEMTVRLEGREYPLRAGDLIAIPPGPEGAHQFLNYSDRPVHFFAASTMIPRDVVDYPDSGKRLFQVDDIGGDSSSAMVLLKGERTVSYFEGEAADEPLAVSYCDGEPVDEPLTEAAPSSEARDPRIVNLEEVAWERIWTSGPFGGEWKRLGRRAGARLLGYTVYRLQPGESPFPFHLHHVNEEFFYVRSGYGELRMRDGTRELRPGDAFACPPGPDGAHAILNRGDRPLEYLALSTMEHLEIAEFPDSRKLWVVVGSPPGGDSDAREVDTVFRLRDAVDYLEGEGVPPAP